jgi:hypothetical protein
VIRKNSNAAGSKDALNRRLLSTSSEISIDSPIPPRNRATMIKGKRGLRTVLSLDTSTADNILVEINRISGKSHGRGNAKPAMYI